MIHLITKTIQECIISVGCPISILCLSMTSKSNNIKAFTYYLKISYTCMLFYYLHQYFI